jgi:stearoyl-CoA desaturase (Delta-9 desaturase)
VEKGDWDPTKWIIRFCAFVGLASDLKRTSDNEIQKAKIITMKNKIKALDPAIDYGLTDEKMPVVRVEQVYERVLDHDKWLIIDGYVLDISSFESEHPGGSSILKKMYGKDATKSFYGNLNNHTRSAKQLMKMLRVARVDVMADGGDSK